MTLVVNGVDENKRKFVVGDDENNRGI